MVVWSFGFVSFAQQQQQQQQNSVALAKAIILSCCCEIKTHELVNSPPLHCASFCKSQRMNAREKQKKQD